LARVFWKFLKSYFFLGIQDKPESPADGMNVEEEKKDFYPDRQIRELAIDDRR
jgi:hypothetical protein